MPTDDAHLRETSLDSRWVLQGNFLQVRRDSVRLPSGQTASREYVVHPGAVMVVPCFEDGRVLLERQFRFPLDRAMVEFPAGKLDAGESTLACAQRELREETGYQAREWAYAGALNPTIAYSNEVIHIWFARGLTAGERALDEGEFLDVFTATPQELLAWCQDGSVTDAKTLTAVLWLQNVLSGAWTLDWQAQAS